jgi:transcriptional regulator with XRE-family HTH domain
MNEANKTDVGRRIRTLRERRGLSLRLLAERSGLSSNAISLIERGENSPTVSSLQLLAAALGVSITAFFEAGHDQTVLFVRPEARLRTTSEGVTMESLGIGLRDQQIEPFLLDIAPGAGNSDQPISHAGEEFVYCLEGQVEYKVGEQLYRLEAGSSLLFKAGLAHAFRNPTGRPARLMMVFNLAESGPLARELHLEAVTERAPDS